MSVALSLADCVCVGVICELSFARVSWVRIWLAKAAHAAPGRLIRTRISRMDLDCTDHATKPHPTNPSQSV